MLAGIILAASAACSGSSADKASPTATVATEPAPTTTTDPYAVPATIDVAYVNQVLAGLDRVMGDVTRLVVRTRTIPPEAYEALRAAYKDPDFLQIQIDNFQSDMRKGFASYKSEPGNQVTTVTQMLTADHKCIFARVQRSYAEITVQGSSDPHILWVALQPSDPARDPNFYNRTHWAYIYDGFPPDRSQPADPCAA